MKAIRIGAMIEFVVVVVVVVVDAAEVGMLLLLADVGNRQRKESVGRRRWMRDQCRWCRLDLSAG